jgi:hypothetical protein
MKLNLLKIGAVIFAIFLLGIIVNSCQIEDFVQKEMNENLERVNFKKRTINFEEFSKIYKGSENVKRQLFSRSNSNYITSIDSSKVLLFEGENFNTYTFKVNSSNNEVSSFDNLIIKEQKGNTSALIVNYKPSEQWINEANSGTAEGFDGFVKVKSITGEVYSDILFTNNQPTILTQRSCTTIVVPLWMPCFGELCPCTDGNGTYGYTYYVDCGEGGGSNNGGNYGGMLPGDGGGGTFIGNDSYATDAFLGSSSDSFLLNQIGINNFWSTFNTQLNPLSILGNPNYLNYTNNQYLKSLVESYLLAVNNNLPYSQWSQSSLAAARSIVNYIISRPDNTNNNQEINAFVEELIELALNEPNQQDIHLLIASLIEIKNTFEINSIDIYYQTDSYRSQMSQSELAIFDNMLPNKQMWYLSSAYKALNKSNELFPNTVTDPFSLYNGRGDAFRHALWNTLSSLTVGVSLTNQLTTAHENRPYDYPNHYKEKYMDLYNNQQGRAIASYSNLNNAVNNVLISFNNGNLVYLTNLDPASIPPGRATNNSQEIPTHP